MVHRRAGSPRSPLGVPRGVTAVYLCMGALLLLATASASQQTSFGLLRGGAALLALAPVLIAARSQEGRRGRPWYLLAASLVLLAVPQPLEVVLPDTIVLDVLANVLYATGHVLLGAAALLAVRMRNEGGDLDGAVDAVIVAVALATVLRTVIALALAAPDNGGFDLTPLLTVLNVTMPAVVTASVMRLSFAAPRAPSGYLLLGGAVVGVVQNVVALMRSAGTEPAWMGDQVFHLLFVLAFLLAGAAALHPSLAVLTIRGSSTEDRPLTTRVSFARLGVLGGALLTVSLSGAGGAPVEGPLVAIGWVAPPLVSLLILVRLGRVVLASERARSAHAAVAALGHRALGEAGTIEVASDVVASLHDVLRLDLCAIVRVGGEGADGTDDLEVLAQTGAQGPALAGIVREVGARVGPGRSFATGARSRTAVALAWHHDSREGDGPGTGTGLLVGCRRRDPLSPSDRSVLQTAGLMLAERTRRQRVEDALRHRALHDPLTGLPNRSRLRDVLRTALQELDERPFAVLFVDLDGFKRVNDTLGHDAGDRLLVEASARMRGVLHHGDVLARLAGDEFVILSYATRDARRPPARPPQTGHGAHRVAERVLEVLSAPFTLPAGAARVGASVGVALPESGGAQEAERLLRRADEAMYRVKAEGRGGVALAEPTAALLETASF